MANIVCSTTVFSKVPLGDALRRTGEIGFRYVDLLMMGGWAHIDPADLQVNLDFWVQTVTKQCSDAGVSALAINGKLSLNPGGIRTDQAITQIAAEAKALFAFASARKIPVITLSAGSVPENSSRIQAMDSAINTFNELVPLAKDAGVVLTIETHSNTLGEAYEDSLRFCREVNGLMLTYDPSHFVMKGFDLKQSDKLLPYSRHVHLRDAVPGNFQAPFGSGSMDFDWVVSALKDHGYSGSISLEYIDSHGREDAVKEACNLKDFLMSKGLGGKII